MSELQTRFIDETYCEYYKTGKHDFAQVYLKSEADNVIAKKDKKIDLYKRGFEEIDKINAYLFAEARHHKYKRCLAMAEWCEATALWSFQAANTLPVGLHATLYGKPVMIEPCRLFKRYVLLTKWHKRWLELAENFKEAK